MLTRLVHKGIITKDELGMGVQITNTLNTIGENDEIHSNLYAMGTLLRGTLYETTAVREIREQAALIANAVIEQAERKMQPQC